METPNFYMFKRSKPENIKKQPNVCPLELVILRLKIILFYESNVIKMAFCQITAMTVKKQEQKLRAVASHTYYRREFLPADDEV